MFPLSPADPASASQELRCCLLTLGALVQDRAPSISQPPASSASH